MGVCTGNTTFPEPTIPREIAARNIPKYPMDSLSTHQDDRDPEAKGRRFFSFLTLGVLRFFSVPQGYVALVTAFGKCIRVVNPGLGWCLSFWGFYQRASHLVPTREEVEDYKEDTVLTKDGVKCALHVVVFYRIVDPIKATFEIEDFKNAIQSLVKATLRNECGKLVARELLAGREQLLKNIKEHLDQDTEPWGISIRLVEIQGVDMGS